MANVSELGLADCIAAAVRAGSTGTIGTDSGWNYQTVDKQYRNSEDEKQTFHRSVLLVTGNWTVIFSCRRASRKQVCRPLSVRNS